MSDSKIKQILLRVSEDEKKQIEKMAKDNKNVCYCIYKK